MKMKDPALKIISNEIVIDTELQFPDGNDYTNVFTKLIKCPRTSRVYISHKIESAKSITELKYGNNKEITNIFDTLIANGAYLTHNKFHLFLPLIPLRTQSPIEKKPVNLIIDQ